MVWALNDAPADGPLERLILIYLGNAATPEGVVAAPDWQALANSAGVPLDAVASAVERMCRRDLVYEEGAGTVLLGVPWGTGFEAPVLPRTKDRIHPADRAYIYERDGYACLRCGSSNLTIDHVQPESLGGRSIRSNFQTLCLSCNAWKGVRVGVEFDYRTEEPA